MDVTRRPSDVRAARESYLHLRQQVASVGSTPATQEVFEEFVENHLSDYIEVIERDVEVDLNFRRVVAETWLDEGHAAERKRLKQLQRRLALEFGIETWEGFIPLSNNLRPRAHGHDPDGSDATS